MLGWAVTFLIVALVALVAALLGFGGRDRRCRRRGRQDRIFRRDRAVRHFSGSWFGARASDCSVM